MDEAQAAQPASTKKKSPLRYILLALSLLIIGGVVFSLGVFSPKSGSKKDQPKVTAGPTPTVSYAHTVLSFSPNPVSLNGSQGSAEVMVDPGENEVTAVQLEVSYDPKVLTNVKIVPTKTFFTSPIVLIDKNDRSTGHYTFALGITPAQQPVKTSGNVVTITFTKVPGTTATQTTIELTPESLATSSGIDVSVLKSSSNLLVNL